MKKVFMTCLAVVAVFAIASSAVAITCTVDQRPAATLLVPYFQVSYDAGGVLVPSGIGARDTILTIGNASAAPTIAHVAIWDRYSNLVLDFNVALSGFDLSSMSMSDVLGGTLPTSDGTWGEVCQKNPLAAVYPNPSGFLRVRPNNPANPTQDNRFAATAYPVPAFGSAVSAAIIGALRANCVTGGIDDLATGYITIDMSNYCTLTNPIDPAYVQNDAIGMENNLWGEIIFTSGFGLPTYGMSTVNLEADAEFGAAGQANVTPTRTYYARYWWPTDSAPANCPNCSASATPPYVCGSGDDSPFLDCNAPWDVGFGDQREPLGLRYAARWFDLSPTITSNFRIWRADSFLNGDCTVPEPVMVISFFDGDENALGGPIDQDCVSGPFGGQAQCGAVSNLAPFETQQLNINLFTHPTSAAGWLNFNFYQTSGNGGSVFDQAWVDYSFEGAIALESILIPGTALDPSTCNPLVDPTDPGSVSVTITPEVPTVPVGFGL